MLVAAKLGDRETAELPKDHRNAMKRLKRYLLEIKVIAKLQSKHWFIARISQNFLYRDQHFPNLEFAKVKQGSRVVTFSYMIQPLDNIVASVKATATQYPWRNLYCKL